MLNIYLRHSDMKKIQPLLTFCTVISVILFIPGCSTDDDYSDADISDLPVLQFDETVRFSESDELLLGGLSSVFVDSDGDLILVDPQQRYVHAVDANGSYIQQIGARGAGPGEYQFPGVVRMGTDNSIHLLDWSSRTIITYRKENGRWSFDSDFSADMQSFGFFSQFFTDGSGEFIIITSSMMANTENDSTIVRKINSENDILLDSIWVAPANERFMIEQNGVPSMSFVTPELHRLSRFEAGYDGSLYYSWSDSLTIFKWDPETGASSVYVDLDLPKSRFTSSDADSILSRFESILTDNNQARRDLQASFPEFKSVMRQFLTDDKGYVWVQIFTDENEPDWLIFDDSGAPVYRAGFNNGHRLTAIRDGHAYTISQSDLDLPTVTAYRYQY